MPIISHAALSLALMLAPTGEPSVEVIVVRRCEVDFERSALLGTSVAGIVAEVRVKVGDTVKSGQILGRLQDNDIRADLEIRAAEAESDVGVRLGEARLAAAQSRLRRSEKLGRQVMISAEELEGQRIEAQSRALDVEEAKFKRKVSALMKKQAEAAIRAREVVSPFDGEVVSVFKQPGESAALNDPVFRVVDSRTMKVTGHLDVVDASRLAKGRRARVTLEIRGADLPIETRAFEGRVVFIDAQISRETQTCRVVVEVPNPDGLLRAGMEARIEILPDSKSTSVDPQKRVPTLRAMHYPHPVSAIHRPEGAWVDSQGRYSAPGDDAALAGDSPRTGRRTAAPSGAGLRGLRLSPGAEYRPWLSTQAPSGRRAGHPTCG